MSRQHLRRYRFATAEQWNTCLFVGVDRDSQQARNAPRPFSPFALPATYYESPGGYAPAMTRENEAVWRDQQGALHRLPYGDDIPLEVTAPFAIAGAFRLVATSSTLWAAGETAESLQGFDLESLTRQFDIDVPKGRVLDVAGDGRDGIYALINRDSAWEIAHYDCAAGLKSTFSLKGISAAKALAYLPSVDRLVVLSADPPELQKLHWYVPMESLAKFSILITAIRPCFDAAALASDGHARLFLAGTDGIPFGGRHHVLTLDPEGNPIMEAEVDERPTGVTGNRKNLLVTTHRGLLRFDTADSVPREASEIKATLITPVLRSPPSENLERWLRVEASAALPAGSSIEIAYAASDDCEVRDEVIHLLKDPALTISQRLQRLRTRLGPWRMFSFHGGQGMQAEESARLSAPLFDVREEYLWVAVTLTASPGGGIPVLSELEVLYRGSTLMENLPAVYRRTQEETGSFLRSLVGVLETTTQHLDARIGALGRHIHPETAPAPWLDFVARWIGLPWDEALSLDQKRSIVMRAADIAKGRGTRAGLEALLESLMPGQPRRFRVVDSTADFGFVTVGGGSCAGSQLPSILAGLPPTSTALGSKAILGRARLPCDEREGSFSELVGRIRIDLSATADEQMKWQSWLESLINEMVPVTARVQLRWLSEAAFRQVVKLDDSLTLGLAPAPRLGTDAVMGIAHLPGRRGISLKSSGVDSDSSLY
jgi:phage tail-like protein